MQELLRDASEVTSGTSLKPDSQQDREEYDERQNGVSYEIENEELLKLTSK